MPIIVTVPNLASGHIKPENGWPVVIYGHGIRKNRIDALFVADTLASQGYATVAIDHPLHGVSPDVEPYQSRFWIENTRFGPIANERTFDADLINNQTQQPGPDGLIDPTGTWAIPGALASFLTGRDRGPRSNTTVARFRSALTGQVASCPGITMCSLWLLPRNGSTATRSR